jgi:hypothetical protein
MVDMGIASGTCNHVFLVGNFSLRGNIPHPATSDRTATISSNYYIIATTLLEKYESNAGCYI